MPIHCNFSTCLPDPKKRLHPAGVSSANSKGGMATRRAELLSKGWRLYDVRKIFEILVTVIVTQPINTGMA